MRRSAQIASVVEEKRARASLLRESDIEDPSEKGAEDEGERNNYQREAFNGDMGIVVAADEEERNLIVRFLGPTSEDDRNEVMYDFHEAGELTLAYACSVHKSQGSEFAAVIMPIVTQHYVMLQRNLLYTAVSRALLR